MAKRDTHEAAKVARTDPNYSCERQNGSHLIIKSKAKPTCEGVVPPVVIPLHNGDCPRGTWRSIGRAAELWQLTKLAAFIAATAAIALVVILTAGV